MSKNNIAQQYNSMVASIEDAKIYDGRGEYNLYDGYKGEYFLYCILMDFEESFARVNYWKSKSRRFLPHCQPFRDLNNPHQIIPQWQKDMAHWADRKEIYMSCDFKDFSPRKGFLCKEYFKIL